MSTPTDRLEELLGLRRGDDFRSVTEDDYTTQATGVMAQARAVQAAGRVPLFTDTPNVPEAPNETRVLIKGSRTKAAPVSPLSNIGQAAALKVKPPKPIGDSVVDNIRAIDEQLGAIDIGIAEYKQQQTAEIDQRIQATLADLTATSDMLQQYAGSKLSDKKRLQEKADTLTVQLNLFTRQRQEVEKALAVDPTLVDADKDKQLLASERARLEDENKARLASERAAQERATQRAEALGQLAEDTLAEVKVKADLIDRNYDPATIDTFQTVYGMSPGMYVTTEPLVPEEVKLQQLEAAQYFSQQFNGEMPSPVEATTLTQPQQEFLQRFYVNKQTTDTGKNAMRQWTTALAQVQTDPRLIAAGAKQLTGDPRLAEIDDALKRTAPGTKDGDAQRAALLHAKDMYIRSHLANSSELEAATHNAAASFVGSRIAENSGVYINELTNVVSTSQNATKAAAYRQAADWVAAKGGTIGSWQDVIGTLTDQYLSSTIAPDGRVQPPLLSDADLAAEYATNVAERLFQVTEKHNEGVFGTTEYDPAPAFALLKEEASTRSWIDQLKVRQFGVFSGTAPVRDAVDQYLQGTSQVPPNPVDQYLQGTDTGAFTRGLQGAQATIGSYADQLRAYIERTVPQAQAAIAQQAKEAGITPLPSRMQQPETIPLTIPAPGAAAPYTAAIREFLAAQANPPAANPSEDPARYATGMQGSAMLRKVMKDIEAVANSGLSEQEKEAVYKRLFQDIIMPIQPNAAPYNYGRG